MCAAPLCRPRTYCEPVNKTNKTIKNITAVSGNICAAAFNINDKSVCIYITTKNRPYLKYGYFQRHSPLYGYFRFYG